MGRELAKVEPILLPAKPSRDRLHAPATMPFLPAWLDSRLVSMRAVHQADATGRHREVMTLPKGLMLNATERTAIERHVLALEPYLGWIPAADVKAEKATLAILTKMMFALPSQRRSEEGNEARGEAYMAALDDVTSWAVAEAVRLWYRGECRKIGDGRDDNYTFIPSPARLRDLAQRVEWRMRARILSLRKLLSAEELTEFTDEHCAGMLGKLQVVFHRIAAAADPVMRKKKAPSAEAAGPSLSDDSVGAGFVGSSAVTEIV